MLNGGVNKEGRVRQWASPHRRIFFATPQTFKNDVFTGARAAPELAHRAVLHATQSCQDATPSAVLHSSYAQGAWTGMAGTPPAVASSACSLRLSTFWRLSSLFPV